jgi:hypothetical protein
MFNPDLAPIFALLGILGEYLLYGLGLSLYIYGVFVIWKIRNRDALERLKRGGPCYHGISRHDPDWEA